MLMRSYLYVPSDNEKFLEKAEDSPADAIILDLEDSVKKDAKSRAEENIRQFLQNTNRQHLMIRLDPLRISYVEDLINNPKISKIFLPKVDSVRAIDLLNLHNSENKPVHALIESPLGLANLEEIAKTRNVSTLGVGEADFFAETVMSVSANKALIDFVRSKVVLTSAALNLLPPIAPVSSNFKELEIYRNDSQELLTMGFWGRACIHPAQVEIANSVFRVDPLLLRKAHHIVQSLREGTRGALVDDEGKMIDAAHLRWAEKYIKLGSISE